MRKISLFTLLLFLVTLTLYAQNKAKYIFYFIGDGMGQSIVNATEYYKGYQEKGGIYKSPLTFTSFPIFGVSTTHSSDYYITDSAAAGTALATGEKTSQGTISMTFNHTEKLKSIAYKAKDINKAVGIMSTVSIDHATPAVFFASQPHRKMAYEIAMDGYDNNFDLYAGSGFVTPQVAGKPNVYSTYKDAGYVILKGKDDISQLNTTRSKVLLIERDVKYSSSLAYAIDRTEDDMSLSDMLSGSIPYLKKRGGKNGFFLMVESGKIDWAEHGNDGKTAMLEVLDFDNAIELAYEFYKKHPKETLIVVTADHETGGFTFGRSETGYNVHFDFIQKQKVSAEKMSAIIVNEAGNWNECQELLTEYLGLWEIVKVSDRDKNDMIVAFYNNKPIVSTLAIKLIMRNAGLGWTSGSHTASSVGVYAIGVGSEQFNGNQDNTDIMKKISSVLK